MNDPIAIRVARRHQAALVLREVPATKTRVEYTAGGSISALDLEQMLEGQLGYIIRLRLRATPVGPTTSIPWEAIAEDGAVVTGKLVLHAAVAEDGVVSWALVTVDPR
jgi:hypothetical protein